MGFTRSGWPSFLKHTPSRRVVPASDRRAVHPRLRCWAVGGCTHTASPGAIECVRVRFSPAPDPAVLEKARTALRAEKLSLLGLVSVKGGKFGPPLDAARIRQVCKQLREDPRPLAEQLSTLDQETVPREMLTTLQALEYVNPKDAPEILNVAVRELNFKEPCLKKAK